MNILLIGGAGFIGSAVTHRFSEDKDFNIFVYEPDFANVSRLEDLKGKITLVRGLLSDQEKIKKIILLNNIDIVIHLVSTLIPGSSYEEYKKEFESVIFPSARLMQFCAENHVKFIFFSSGGTIYGNSKWGRFRESDNPSPISYYGLSKQMLEDCVLFEHRRGGLEYLIVRPSNPYGPGQNLFGNQGLIAVLIGKVLKGEPIEIWGDGSSIRDYIYIDDLTDAFYQLVKKNIYNKIINIGSGHGYSVNDVMERVMAIADKNIEVIYQPGRPVDVDAMVLDIALLRKYVDVKHTHMLEGMKRFFQYALSNFNN